jgi:hypothetical protein
LIEFPFLRDLLPWDGPAETPAQTG